MKNINWIKINYWRFKTEKTSKDGLNIFNILNKIKSQNNYKIRLFISEEGNKCSFKLGYYQGYLDRYENYFSIHENIEKSKIVEAKNELLLILNSIGALKRIEEKDSNNYNLDFNEENFIEENFILRNLFKKFQNLKLDTENYDFNSEEVSIEELNEKDYNKVIQRNFIENIFLSILYKQSKYKDIFKRNVENTNFYNMSKFCEEISNFLSNNINVDYLNKIVKLLDLEEKLVLEKYIHNRRQKVDDFLKNQDENSFLKTLDREKELELQDPNRNLPFVSKTTSIKYIFTNENEELRNFLIPKYQRPYSWNEETFKEMLNEIEKILEYENWNLFLNHIIWKQMGSKFEIIDGQQRMMSFIILIYGLIDVCLEKGFEMPDFFEETFLKNDRSGNFILKNKLNYDSSEYSKEFFKRIINFEDLQQNEKYNKNNNIVNNFIATIEWIKEILDKQKDEDSQKQVMETIWDFIFNKTWITTSILVDEQIGDQNVQNLFEKINSSGKPLTEYDLLKNYILRYYLNNNYKKSEEEVDENIKLFVNLLSNKKMTKNDSSEIFELSINNTVFKDFVKTIIFGNPNIEIHKLYNKEKTNYKILESCLEFVRNQKYNKDILDFLIENALIYRKILEPSFEVAEKYGIINNLFTFIKEEILMLHDVQVIRPLIFKLISKDIFNIKEEASFYEKKLNNIKAILKVISNFHIKSTITFDYGQSYTSYYDKLIQFIFKKEQEDITINSEIIIDYIKQENSKADNRRMPSQEEFIKVLQGNINLNNKSYKKLLFRLEKEWNSEFQILDKMEIAYIFNKENLENKEKYLGELFLYIKNSKIKLLENQDINSKITFLKHNRTEFLSKVNSLFLGVENQIEAFSNDPKIIEKRTNSIIEKIIELFPEIIDINN